jgi:hypothetical protein
MRKRLRFLIYLPSYYEATNTCLPLDLLPWKKNKSLVMNWVTLREFCTFMLGTPLSITKGKEFKWPLKRFTPYTWSFAISKRTKSWKSLGFFGGVGWNRVSLYSPGWPGTLSVAKVGLELVIFLPQPPSARFTGLYHHPWLKVTLTVPLYYVEISFHWWLTEVSSPLYLPLFKVFFIRKYPSFLFSGSNSKHYLHKETFRGHPSVIVTGT